MQAQRSGLRGIFECVVQAASSEGKAKLSPFFFVEKGKEIFKSQL